MKTCVLAAVMLLTLGVGSATATTIHYWQFENSPGFLVDSAGSAVTTALGPAAQVTLPGSGRGSSFDDVVGGTASALEVDLTGRLTTASFGLTEFTIEVLAHADALLGTFGNSLAGEADSQFTTDIGWLLQVRNSGSQRELELFLGDGASHEFVSRSARLPTGRSTSTD